jgi:ABC-2 type transport system permease protein
MYLSRRSLAIAGAGTRLLLSDPAPMLVTIITPLVLSAFLLPASRAQLHEAGFAGANGAEQLVPGMAVLFAFLNTALVGTLFFREHAWGTWDRLRASGASTLDIVLGKVAPLYVVNLAQMVVLFVAGRFLFGYRPNGSMVALAIAVATFVAVLVAFGVMLVAVFRTMDQALVIGNVGGMLMAGLGGALSPASSLPGWAQALAHASPAYWALQVMSDISLRHAGLGHLVAPLLALLGFGALFSGVAAVRFRASDAKIGTT